MWRQNVDLALFILTLFIRALNFIMIIFAITRDGYLELEPVIKSVRYPVWVGKGVLDRSDIDQLRAAGVDLTDFNYEISPNDQETIEIFGVRSTLWR